MSKIFILLHKR